MHRTEVFTASAASPPSRLRTILPGLLLCLAAAGVSYALGLWVRGLSPLIVAIVLGIVAVNTGLLPAATQPGIDFSAKKLLRLGIVFLGLQLSLGGILALGAPILLVVVCIVAGGIVGTILLGRLLRVPEQLTLLVACGFSICGAAAVAGAAGVTDPDDEHEEHTVTAVALVVIFGTLMIPIVPFVAPLLGLDHEQSGLFGGGSVHEIAQVVAVGGILGGSALTLAVLVKLARVLMLAPVVALLAVRTRRRDRAAQTRLPPIVPLFIIGFLAMVALRSFAPLPAGVLATGQLLQTGLLAAAMFGLGCGVRIRKLMRVGLRPFALAALATLLVAGIAYAGVVLVA